MPASPTYNYYLTTNGTYPTTPTYTGTDASHTFTGLTQGTTYDVKVTVMDNAGNTGEGTVTGISTGTVAGAEEGLQTGNITLENTSWSNGKASITLGTSTNFMIQYKVGSSGTWQPASYTSDSAGADVTVSNLSHNDIVFARLLDDAGNAGSQASVTITDGTAPTVNSFTITAYDTTSISVSASATDNQSGIYSYEFQYKLSTASDYTTAETTVTSDGTCTYKYTGLADDTTYDLRVIVTDKAGLTNNKTATQKTVDANVGPVIASATVSDKTTNSIKVTANATDENGDTLTYKLYTSTSENGTYTQKASTSASQNSTVTLNATGLSQYTTYWWYVQVSDGEETISSSKQSVRTYCPGTGYTCYTKSCSGTRTITCTTCGGDGESQQYCPGGTSTSVKCSSCNGYGETSEREWTDCSRCGGSGGDSAWVVCDRCHGTGMEYYGSGLITCTVCGGSGTEYEYDNCSYCGGSGGWYDYYDVECYRCDGTGYVTQTSPCEHGYTSSHYYNDTCTRCNGGGTITTTPCTHGYSSSHRYCDHYTNTSVASHSYCSHGETSQHDD